MYEKRITLMQRRRLKPASRIPLDKGHVKQAPTWAGLLHARQGETMKITVQFDDDDTLPDRLKAMADHHQTTPDDIIHRALAEYLGDFGLTPVPDGFQPKNIMELAVARGILKPKNTT